ncbi:MAG: hypothetical protein R3242_09625 [Akkermansiaceae bacterium]|nr:hypothetical protein [Akkermansiaceae bacterium]
MTPEELAQSAMKDDQPPLDLTPPARVLWLAKAGEWHEAHEDCQTMQDEKAGAWIHAWLHREEGDYGNACYWYNRADKSPKPQDYPLEEEWAEIAKELI